MERPAGSLLLQLQGRIDGLSRGQPVTIGRCVVRPGDYVFADIDGVVVVPAALADRAFPLALEKATAENRVREELAAGFPESVPATSWWSRPSITGPISPLRIMSLNLSAISMRPSVSA